MKDSIHPKTRLGTVHIIVSNLQRSLEFYEYAVGLGVNQRQDDTAHLASGGLEPLLHLTELPWSESPTYSTGLYHFALRVPTRKELAMACHRILERGITIQGCSDHIVSEAIYLHDPDGNGIEIYCDRPSENWRDETGSICMGTQPLAISGLLAELEACHGTREVIHPKTSVGHIHLHVGDLADAEQYYCGVLGFELVQRYGTSAAFVSAGGYHHHIGFNTWASAIHHPSPLGATGLHSYTVCLPHRRALSDVADRIRYSGHLLEEHKDVFLARDPSGNCLMLATASNSAKDLTLYT